MSANRPTRRRQAGRLPPFGVSRFVSLLVPLAVSLGGLAGCAAPVAFWQAEQSLAKGDEAAWLRKLEEAAALEPRNVEYRMALHGARERLAVRLANRALTSLSAGRYLDAKLAVEEANRLAPDHPQTRAAWALVEAHERREELMTRVRRAESEGRLDAAQDLLRQHLRENGADRDARRQLRDFERRERALAGESPADGPLGRRVTVEFRQTPVRNVLLAIAGRLGVNFTFDPKATVDTPVTVHLKDVSVDAAISHVLSTTGLERKVLAPGTYLIFSPTPDKVGEHRALVTRTFYVTNADVKQTATLLRQMARVRDVFVDDREGLLVIRDHPEVIRLAERLVAIHDRPRPEVLLEVEVMEVGENALTDIGLRWPDRVSAGLSPTPSGGGTAGDSVSFPLPQFRNLDSSFVTVTLPSPLLAATLRAQAGSANILANPRIRVRQREKAKILIGDKVPVVTTTSTANGFVSESVNYLDVGIKLEVQPEITAEDEVGVAVSLEVSNIAREIRTNSGSIAYQVGTRSASTVLQLQDGETQVLAGLISDEERSTSNKVPLLGDLPVLGRLFSQRAANRSRSEIVLLLTPRIVRSHASSGPSSESFTSGADHRVAGSSAHPVPGQPMGMPGGMAR